MAGAGLLTAEEDMPREHTAVVIGTCLKAGMAGGTHPPA